MPDYSTYTDEQLVLLMKEGNDAAFREIYDRYWKLIFSIAIAKLDNLHDAEEIVQNIFSDFWERRQSIQILKSLKYYLIAAVKYQVMTVLAQRKRRRITSELLDKNISSNNLPDQSLLLIQLQQELESIVSALPERCQLIYRLSREEGKSHKEIAKILNVSDKTVETQITRSLSRIRRGLGDTALLFLLLFS